MIFVLMMAQYPIITMCSMYTVMRNLKIVVI